MSTAAPEAVETASATTPEIPAAVQRLRAAFRTGRTKPLAWRREQLKRLVKLLRENEERVLEALKADMGKPVVEAYAGEVGLLIAELRHMLDRLAKWTAPEKVSTPLHSQLGKSVIYREPLGVVLVISPWNYPVQLALLPLAGALAAGNCVLLKPSEIAAHTSTLLSELIPRYLDPECVTVVEGGVIETTALLEQRFDHVFFTGSTAVGRVVYQAAARHLTPVTLELGGKSPCLVDRDVDLEVAARRIVWGKFFNAGQTCVAPDYVLVERSCEGPLLERLQATLREFYGEDPRHSPDFARIVSDRHYQRLLGLIGDEEVVTGGKNKADAGSRYIPPTILRGVSPESKVMSEEIFGPILPVLTVSDMEAAVEFVNDRPKPLALYVFTRDKDRAQRVLDTTSSGGACVNDIMSHLAVPDLPFGGVGESGMGAYHGRDSVETFSHRKSVLHRSTLLDVRLRYPPYADLKWIKRLLG